MRKKKENQKESDQRGKKRMEKFQELQESKKEETPTPKSGKRIIAYQKKDGSDWEPLYGD